MRPYSSLPLDEYPAYSQTRRPWSPVDVNTNGYQREASDPSFEAFDLADYAATLHGRHNSPGMLPMASPGVSQPYSPLENTHTRAERPFTPQTTPSLTNRTSIRSPPLSFSVHDSPLRSGSYVSRWNGSPMQHSNLSHPTSAHWPITDGGPYSTHSGPVKLDVTSEEVDMSDFPKWSRPWFEKDSLQRNQTRFQPLGSRSINSYYGSHIPSSEAHSQRELLPWSGEVEASSPYISPEVKEARLRALHEEFAKTGNPIIEDDFAVGGVDNKGKIVTDGPTKRTTARVLQGLLALGVVIASLYSAIILKPKEAPPPRGSIASILLYIISVLTFLLLLYMFLFRPCCCSGRRKQSSFTEGPGGMMVLPVQSLPGPKKKGKKGKKGKNSGSVGESVQVNLIVDPATFSPRNERDDDENESMSQSDARAKRASRRVGIFEGLRREEQWRTARSELKRLFALDIVLAILWAVVFVFILLGKRCPTGKFDGWCDSYNSATAFACFLMIAFSFSVYFDIKDLHASKASPRTRT